MSLLNEFFVADPAAITEDLRRRGPAGRFATVSAAGLTELELALLLVAIEEQPADAALERLRDFHVAAAAGSEGPWVVRLPAALRDALADGDADRRRYAADWSRAEELAGARVADLAELLDRLAPLARDARASGASVYLWISL